MYENYVNYEVLEDGVSVYSKQAEEIVTIMSTLKRMNDELQRGWRNETAVAFIELYDTKYEPALKEASEAIANISQYISSYMANKKEEDTSGAASLRG